MEAMGALGTGVESDDLSGDGVGTTSGRIVPPGTGVGAVLSPDSPADSEEGTGLCEPSTTDVDAGCVDAPGLGIGTVESAAEPQATARNRNIATIENFT